MKILKKYIAVWLIATMTIASCSDFLDREPFSDLPSEGFYTTEKNIDLAAIGMYGTLRTFYQNYVVLAELPADNAFTTDGAAGNVGQLDKFSIVGLNNLLSNAWNQSYQSILQANKVLESLPGITFNTPTKKAQIEGEARFVRALNYFNMVRMFGKVPLVTTVINQQDARNLVRNEVDDVYQLITEDLEVASSSLPPTYSGNNVGRATRWAALSLLGKVYLTRQQFTEAVNPLKEVVEAGPFELLPNFADIFNPGNANHRESIFEIQYEGGTLGMGSRWSSAAHPRQLANTLGISTADETLPTADIVETFQNADEALSARFQATIGTMQYQNAGGAQLSARHVKKHYMEHTIQNQSDDNWPLIRLADVMLMYAEALNETSAIPPQQAVAQVNSVRRRAFGLATGDTSRDLPGIQTASQQAFGEAIALERRLELAFEGHRWFDLLRTGKYMEIMNNHFRDYFSGNFKVESFHRLYPVPQREIDINPLLKPNNEGYN